MQEVQEMHWTEHLAELRRRIVSCLIVWVVGLSVGFFYAGDMIQWIKRSVPNSGMTWNAFSPWDGITLYVKFAMIASFALLGPFALYQLWSFVKPGLRPVERRGAIQYVPLSALLFIIGAAFAYYVVFPLALSFTSSVTRALGLQETYGIVHYVDFLFSIVFPVSLIFELPVIIMFLTRIRILNPLRLKKMRRVAWFVLIFVGVTITPPDVISDLLVSVPLVLLYEVSVWLSGFVYRKQLREQEVAEGAEAARA